MGQGVESTFEGGVGRSTRQTQTPASARVKSLPQKLEVALGGRVRELAQPCEHDTRAQGKAWISFAFWVSKVEQPGFTSAGDEAMGSDSAQIGFAFGHGEAEDRGAEKHGWMDR